jgi:uncharacterized membrane protein YdjX (TVP38/TMEM64 family)/Fe-S oxidoreductase
LGHRMATQDLANRLRAVSEKCIECKLCQKECAFLQRHGKPKAIADAFDPLLEDQQAMAFECSLCGLCTALCPVDIDPAGMFLEMRREAVRLGGGDYPEHGVILGFERRGTSRRYTWYALPQGCDTVFFPGCNLPGTRPQRAMQLFECMKESFPALGIVLDCCTKPSHDLGREDVFHAMFAEMRDWLLAHGVRTVLAACPNCHHIFREHGGPIAVKSVYEILDEKGAPQSGTCMGTVFVHDPCAVRFEESIHGAVRGLIEKAGLGIEPMRHQQKKTLCCGEGGSVGFLAPEFARRWSSIRKEEATGRRIITYCGGCAGYLGKVAPTSHVLDLVFDPQATVSGKAKASRPPWTYWNRIRLKARFKKLLATAPVTRERTFLAERKASRAAIIPRILVFIAVIGIVASVRMTGAAHYLEQETLKNLIESCGILAPLLYMLFYALAPALFLPGLPLTIAGGLIFGPFWGVVYTITSATLGACLAFLISRYLARDWVARRLKSPRWKRLDEEVERHGWKVVALTRLIPLFPFNLLNYAFGLTRVKFLHYALATFFCMLPACIAFIVFSSSFWDLLRGNVSAGFLTGLLLVAAVSVLPVVYGRYKGRMERLPKAQCGLDPETGTD